MIWRIKFPMHHPSFLSAGGQLIAVETGRFMKPGKVVLILARCYSGCKAIIMRSIEDGTSEHPYKHALVARIDSYPCKVTATMLKKKTNKKSKIKSFVKVYNYNQLMPTGNSVDISLNKKDIFKDPVPNEKARWEAKVKFEERYMTGKNKWFLKKFRFFTLFFSIIKNKKKNVSSTRNFGGHIQTTSGGEQGKIKSPAHEAKTLKSGRLGITGTIHRSLSPPDSTRKLSPGATCHPV
jgi:large subunit ribosomal protein L27e